MTATEAKARLLGLLNEVETGEEIEITRHGKVVARLAPARGPHGLKGLCAGAAMTTSDDEGLFATGLSWEIG